MMKSGSKARLEGQARRPGSKARLEGQARRPIVKGVAHIITPRADHLCKPNHKCMVSNSRFMHTGLNANMGVERHQYSSPWADHIARPTVICGLQQPVHYRHESINGSGTYIISLGQPQSTQTIYVWSPTGCSCTPARTTTFNPHDICVVSNSMNMHTGVNTYIIDINKGV